MTRCRWDHFVRHLLRAQPWSKARSRTPTVASKRTNLVRSGIVLRYQGRLSASQLGSVRSPEDQPRRFRGQEGLGAGVVVPS